MVFLMIFPQTAAVQDVIYSTSTSDIIFIPLRTYLELQQTAILNWIFFFLISQTSGLLPVFYLYCVVHTTQLET